MKAKAWLTEVAATTSGRADEDKQTFENRAELQHGLVPNPCCNSAIKLYK